MQVELWGVRILFELLGFLLIESTGLLVPARDALTG